MHLVRDVSYIGKYKLHLTFDDGVEKIVDLEPHLDGEIFEPLHDTKFFQKVRVNQDIDTITWPNGADMSPDFLYEIGVDVQKKPQSA